MNVEGGDSLTEQEKDSAEAIAKAITELPLELKKYVQGYAEGVVAAMQRSEEDERDRREQE